MAMMPVRGFTLTFTIVKNINILSVVNKTPIIYWPQKWTTRNAFSMRNVNKDKRLNMFYHTSSTTLKTHTDDSESNMEKPWKDAKKDKATKPKIKKSVIKSNIEEHDLQIKIKQMIKWIEKGMEINVTIEETRSKRGISSANIQKDLQDKITENLKEIGIVQKTSSTSKGLHFNVKPKDNDVKKDDLKPLTIKELQALKSD